MGNLNCNSELHNSGVFRHRLSQKESMNLYRALPLLTSEMEAVNSAEVIALRMRECFSNQTWNTLKRFEQDPSLDILVIDNFPVNSIDMPETPVAEELDIRSFSLTAAIQIGTVSNIGQHPLSYARENKGRPFRHVTGKISSMGAISSHGALKTLPWHVDQQTLPIAHIENSRGQTVSPQTLSLFCMRTQLDVPTRFLPIRTINEHLGGKSIEALQRAIFRFQPPESVEDLPPLESAPVLIKHGKELYVRFGDGVTTDVEDGQHALNELRELFANKAYWVPILLVPGSLVLFKNNKVLHSRSGFQPLFDGADRWFIRLYSAEKHLIIPVHPEVTFISR